jgi:hypothetical protein
VVWWGALVVVVVACVCVCVFVFVSGADEERDGAGGGSSSSRDTISCRWAADSSKRHVGAANSSEPVPLRSSIPLCWSHLRRKDKAQRATHHAAYDETGPEAAAAVASPAAGYMS